jgi:hypothetical protein
MNTKLRTALAPLLLLAHASGCASVRSATRDLSNSDRTGETAPPIEGGTWVIPYGYAGPEVAAADWKLLVVFNPE